MERKKLNLEYEARERKVRDLEQEEKRRDKTPILRGSYFEQEKMLQNDEGSENVCKNYHVTVQKSLNMFKSIDESREDVYQNQKID